MTYICMIYIYMYIYIYRSRAIEWLSKGFVGFRGSGSRGRLSKEGY